MRDPVSQDPKPQPKLSSLIRWISRVICKNPTTTSVAAFALVLLLCFARWHQSYVGPTILDSRGLVQKLNFSFSTVELGLLLIGLTPEVLRCSLGLIWIIALLSKAKSLIILLLEWGECNLLLKREREFNFRRDQRIFAGKPMGHLSLGSYALWAFLRLSIGLYLASECAAAAGRNERLTYPTIFCFYFALLLIHLSLSRIGDVLFIVYCDDFTGYQILEPVRILTERHFKAREAKEAERRRSLPLWCGPTLFMGCASAGIVGYFWLSEWQRISLLQGWVIGFLAWAAPMYLTQLKPRGWRAWSFSSVGAVVAYLLAVLMVWQPLAPFLGLGAVWGIATGWGVLKIHQSSCATSSGDNCCTRSDDR
ncbi:MAG: hypothetical protein JNN07_21460 [Verrucomicrobiales bacterium]|nr:hypothetical protein [Verrucomicrobiales bacterium]